MQITRITTFLPVLLVLASLHMHAGGTHDGRIYPSPLPEGRSLELAAGGAPVDLSGSVIVIRYLGFSCTHCVQQLTYLNEHAERLARLGVRVIAFSDDDAVTVGRMLARLQYDRSVIMVMSDADHVMAQAVGARFVKGDTLFDLHAAVVIREGRVVTSILSDEPYMNINRLVSLAAPQAVKNPSVQAGGSHPVDAYLTAPISVNVVAGPADNINGPVDLDFDQGPLHPNDLWIVNTDQLGYRLAIIHDAPLDERSLTLRKDSRASHFMWRTMGIAMSSNGAFATAQNGENGDFDPFYQFMGPTLWSSDTAVLARLNQTSRTLLGSHLDMLHQSPIGYGIAFERDNAYWVSDGYYNDIARYDFFDPHEVGGHDHSDGIVRRYPEAVIDRGERGRPAHMDMDDERRWLYYVNPGTNSVHRLDTWSGSLSDNLTPPEESYEDHQEYSEWKGATVERLIDGGIGEPVGIEVSGDRLLVGDRLSGRIHVYRIETQGVSALGSIATGASELLGIVLGPDMRIWFVDQALSTVNRIDAGAQSRITARRDVAVIDSIGQLTFAYTNALNSRSVSFTVVRRVTTADGFGPPDTVATDLSITADGMTTTEFDVDVDLASDPFAYEYRVIENDGTTHGGVRAYSTVVPRSARRVIVDDVLTETYRITPAIEQTGREDYVSLRADIFLRAVDSLTNLELVVWNLGSYGDLSVVDDAVIQDLVRKDVEFFLIGDDPLIMRTNLPSSLQFFSQFGVSFRGVDEVVPDNGQRVFQGVDGDTITDGMRNIDCQLPALEHDRGGDFVPNILFRVASENARPILTRDNGARVGSVRLGIGHRRSVILGINAARFLDGRQRTTLMDRTLTWLENAPREVIEDTTTSVAEGPIGKGLTLEVHGNPATTHTTIVIKDALEHVSLDLFSLGGQLIKNVHVGTVRGGDRFTVDVTRLSAGTYFFVASTPTSIVHASFVKQ
jgi:peroxiredoxin